MRKRAVRVASVLLPSATIAIVGFALLRSPTTQVTPDEFLERPPLTDRIALATPAEAERKRGRLRRYVFGDAELPQGLPVVTRKISDPEFAAGLPNLARIDRLVARMPSGFRSVAYHVIPRRGNHRLLVYHNGHQQGLGHARSTVAYFLDRGYSLLVFAMPFAGFNTNPETVATRCGRITLRDGGGFAVHDPMACLPSPLRYFVEPIAVALNYVSSLDYRLTAMIGLSGGGWTTMLYAALDPRVQRSYPVAGSIPHYIAARRCSGLKPSSIPRCFGDIEQRIPGLYRIANHLELYVLGSWGEAESK